jgi:signal transduction histidine kinase
VAEARSHPLIADVVLALAVFLVSAPRFFLAHSPSAWVQDLVLSLALVVPLVWRRRYPVPTFLVLCSVAAAQWVLHSRLVADLALLIGLYTVATRSPRRLAVAAAVVLEVGVALETAQRVLGGSWVRSFVYLTAMVAAAYFLGSSIRTRRSYLAALVERAERLEMERDQQARIAAAAERAEIAREMHDVVAHSLAVMITMAEAAAAKSGAAPDRSAEAMRQVSETGRVALSETRRLLGVLRTDRADGALVPQPGLDQLDALLDQVRATGLDARLTLAGRPFAMPESAQLAVYRIVQEALTNTLKHAAGATAVAARLRFAEPRIDVEVVDDGRSAPPAGTGRSGHGLVGMRERAAMYGGSVHAGPLAAGGWGVHARLDLSERDEPAK